MGAWGEQSDANDSCWDMLCDVGLEDFENVTQEKVDIACRNLMGIKMPRNMTADNFHDFRSVLGCIVWILREGMTIKSKYLLLRGLKLTKMLPPAEMEWGGWVYPAKRQKELWKENKMIQFALDNSGTIRKERKIK